MTKSISVTSLLGRKILIQLDTDTKKGKELAKVFGEFVVLTFDEDADCMVCDEIGRYTEGAYTALKKGECIALCFEHIRKVDWLKKIERD